MSPDAATPRPRSARRGSSHLKLVTDDTPTLSLRAPAPEQLDAPATGRHAAPRPLPATGSVTMRALLALGALVSVLGLSIGRAEAVLSHTPAEAEPEEPAAPAPGAASLTPTPATPATAPKSRTAGHWAPAVEPVKSHTYTLAAPIPGTGRHRKPAATEGWGAWNPDTWGRPAGKHRKPSPPATRHEPAGKAPAGRGKNHPGKGKRKPGRGKQRPTTEVHVTTSVTGDVTVIV